MTALRTRLLSGLATLLAVASIVGVGLWLVDPTGAPGAPGEAAASGPAPAAIDLPAADRTIPPDAVLDVRAVYGARGDGVADDTAALQRAISENLGYAKFKKVLYFPAGTYRITRPLEWRLPSGVWSTWLTLQGANRDRTVLKLDDAAPAFADAANPRAMIYTGSQNPYGPDGSGNEAGNNFLYDLTMNVGERNPGATAVDFMSNNRGAIRNVAFTAPAGSGSTAIALTRRYPGPTLIDNVVISGFDVGIRLAYQQYGVTVRGLRLNDQRTTGILNPDNSVAAQDLRSTNAVPAIINGTTPETTASLTLIDSHLASQGGTQPAIDSTGAVFIRGTSSEGYRTTLRQAGQDVALPADLSDWSSLRPVTVDGTDARSLGLPSAQPPVEPDRPLSQYAGVNAFGALPDDPKDDTAGIQAALDSGQPVVYFPSGRYRISRTLNIPDTVSRIEGFETSLLAGGGVFGPTSPAAMLSTAGSTGGTLRISQLYFVSSPTVVNVERTGSRPLDLVDLHIGGTPLRASPGPIAVTDVDGSKPWTFAAGQQVSAVHLNAEPDGPKVINNGADLRILGLKTERPGAVVQARGGQTEVLGGLIYAVTPPPPGQAAFTAEEGGVLFASTCFQADDPTRMYPVLAQSGPQSSPSVVAPPRSFGAFLPALRIR